jgi:hypothetical protein
MTDNEEHDQQTMPPGSLAESFGLKAVIDGLLLDLAELRAGRISVGQARAAADLGRTAIRGMQLIVQAQRVLIDGAKKVDAVQTPAPTSRRGRRHIEGRADG